MPINLDALDALMQAQLEELEAAERTGAAEQAAEEQEQTLVFLPVTTLSPHPTFAKGVPFAPASEERIAQIAESIRRNGLLSPLIVRPLSPDRYQILAGHTRWQAATELGYDELPCIVKDVPDDEALDILIADNLAHRLNGLKPSEKANSYKIRLDNMRRRAGRPPKENSAPLEQNLDDRFSVERLADDSPDSRAQIQRYIRLTYLIAELLEMVDEKRIGFRVAVALSYLCEPSQRALYEYLSERKQRVTQKAADELRALDADPAVQITPLLLEGLFNAPPQRAPRVMKLQLKPIRQYFPKNATPEEIEETILRALEGYFKNQ